MKSFSIKNIKSFKDSGIIELKPITILVGKNSCGKSSLLRFPVMLSQSILADSESPLLLYGKMVDYGNYEDVVYGKDSNENIEFTIHFEVDINNTQDSRFTIFEITDDHDLDYRDVSLKVSVGKKNGRVCVNYAELFIEEKCLSGFYCEEDGGRFELNYIRDENELIEEKHVFNDVDIDFSFAFFPSFDEGEVFSKIAESYYQGLGMSEDQAAIQSLYNRIRNEGSTYEIEVLDENEKKIKRVLDGVNYASTIMSHLFIKTRREAIRLSYIGPFRESPERIYRNSEGRSRNVGTKGENVSNLFARDYQKKNRLIDTVSEWLYDELGYRVVVNDMGSNLFQILLEDKNGIKSNILDVGYGVSQVLPIITQVMRSALMFKSEGPGFEKDPTKERIFIEQPELHLHPAAQAELADLFCNCVNVDKRIGLVIETHSEHLIRKLQVLIADKDNNITNEDVVIYYIDKDTEGVASVEEMRILQDGRFEKPWPNGFFDKSHELTMQLLEKNQR